MSVFTSFLMTQCSVTPELLKLEPSTKGIRTAFPFSHQAPPPLLSHWEAYEALEVCSWA